MSPSQCCLTCGQRLPRPRRPNAPEGFAYCGKCDELKPFDQFHADASKPSGRSSSCAGCKAVANEARRDSAKPDRKRYRKRAAGDMPALTEPTPEQMQAIELFRQQAAANREAERIAIEQMRARAIAGGRVAPDFYEGR